MLILSRKCFQTIHIGDNIVVKVLRIGRTTVKIGIEAPENVRVFRAEIYDQPPKVESNGNRDTKDPDYDHVIFACSDQFPQIPTA